MSYQLHKSHVYSKFEWAFPLVPLIIVFIVLDISRKFTYSSIRLAARVTASHDSTNTVNV
jgi:hypothetical protein